MLIRPSLLTCVGLLAACTGCGINAITAREPIELDVPWSDYTKLVVRTMNGQVDLTVGTEAASMRVVGEKRASGATIDEAQQNLASLELTAAADPQDARTLVLNLDVPEEIRSRNPGATLKVAVPRACAADIHTGNAQVIVRGMTEQVNVETSNGSVVLTDLTGPASVRTSNGRIEAHNLGGDLRARSSNGAIVVRSLAGNLVALTSNGRIEATGVRGGVDATSSNGSIRVDATPPVDGSVSLTTSNGSIDARLPQTIQGPLTVTTSNGSVNMHLAPKSLQEVRFDKHSFSAVMNGGGAGRILARTSNGSITLNPQQAQ